MTISDYHKAEKPWFLKAVSLFVIFTFLLTQSDVQLAFANIAAPPPTAQPISSDIHYMQDLDGWLDDGPLSVTSPDEAGGDGIFPGELESEEPPVSTTEFLDLANTNPLMSEHEGEIPETTEDEDGIVTVSYDDGTYFKYDKNQNNQIIEIRDFTKEVYDPVHAKTSYDLETRTFDYSTPGIVRIDTWDGATDGTYQKFSLNASGGLENILESGEMVGGSDVLVRRYDYSANKVTVYSHSDTAPLIERDYEMDVDGELGRLLEYHEFMLGENDQLLEVQGFTVNYDDINGTKIVYDSVTGYYWKYELLEGGETGALFELGERDLVSGDVTFRVELATKDVAGESIDVYSFSDPGDVNFGLVYERLEEGGIGRILKFRTLENGITTDLEYIYETDSVTGDETITILNYETNTFLKLGFVPGMEPTETGLIESSDNLIEAGMFTTDGVRPQYQPLMKRDGSVWVVTDPNDNQIFQIFQVLPNGDLGSILRLRGPPEVGSDLISDIVYEYDTDLQTVTAYDLTTQNYATYEWTQSGATNLIDAGIFSLSASGSISDLESLQFSDTKLTDTTPTEFDISDELLAFSLANAALHSLLTGISGDFQRVRIEQDSDNPDIFYVVLRYGDTEYEYSVNQNNSLCY